MKIHEGEVVAFKNRGEGFGIGDCTVNDKRLVLGQVLVDEMACTLNEGL